jgi:O-antigen/teichoic acid export membrane protein
MSLLEKSLSAFLWGSAGTFTKLFMALGSQIILARLLGPEQYGVFAIGAIVVSFANFLSDFGISYGLIQKKTVSDDDIRYVLGWQLLLGSVVAVLLVLGAETIAEFFNETSSAWVIKSLAAVCVANSLCSVSMNLLKRALDYKALHIAQVLGYFIGYIIVGISLALAGFGAASLVAAWIVQAWIQLMLMYYVARHPLAPTLKHVEGSSAGNSMLIYGRNVLTANLTNWGLANIDRVFIGKRFSVVDIGLYSTAYNLLYNGTSALLGVIQSISFSASSRIQEDIGAQRHVFLGVSGGSLLLVGPIFVSLAIVSDTFILVLYGEKWKNAAEIFRPIALAMPLFLLWGLATPMLWTAGKGKLEGLLNLPLLCLWSLTVYLASSFSPQIVAQTVLILYVLRTGLFVGVTAQALQLNVSSYFRACLPGAILSLIVMAPLGFMDSFLRSSLSSPLLCLLIEALAGLLLWGAGFRLVRMLLQPAVNQALSQFSSRLPSWLAILVFGNLNNMK